MLTLNSWTLFKLHVTPSPLPLPDMHLPQTFTLSPRYTFKEGEPYVEIGKKLQIKHDSQYHCTLCHRSVKKLWSGFCFPCLKTKAAADNCVLNPEQCHFLLGTCREPKWGLANCYQKHYLYLAFTDKFKVGITRASQIPTRWIDQGATQASIIAEVSSRHQAGVLEKSLAPWVGDKSHWSKMLAMGNRTPSSDEFQNQRNQLVKTLQHLIVNTPALKVPLPPEAPSPSPIKVLESAAIARIHYPLENLPPKIVSTTLEKNPSIDEVITGMKGQYIFFPKTVMNIRRHEGFVVDVVVKD